MRIKKRLFGFLLALVMTVCLLPFGTALAEEPEGSLAPVPEDGEGLTWTDLGLEPFPSGEEGQSRHYPAPGGGGCPDPPGLRRLLHHESRWHPYFQR